MTATRTLLPEAGSDAEADATAETALASPPGPARPRLTRGAAVGRYLVLEPLGAGGMGVVYRAYDPELDRGVALKLLRAGPVTSSAGRARLLREAQALAKLAHPNVIAVHDVGAAGDEVFIAMELCAGPTLRAWLSEQPRPVGEVVAAFVAAGRGLAAAHRAGLIHRDFKPDNVIVGDDGRVRVLDFGLARTAATGAPEEPPGAGGGDERLPLAELTRAGGLVGTPAYMAPEQLLGQPFTERTDQFSFCVALYEALHGERPFAGDSLEELAASVTAGVPRPAPRASRVPARLRQALLRGLSVDPAARFPTLDALLAALDASTAAARRRRWLTFAVAAVAALGLIALWTARPRGAAPCRGAEARLAGVWDPAVAAAMADRFRATDRRHAAATSTQVAAALDGYGQAWADMRRDACEATRVRGEQSEALLDERMRCLDGRLLELRALTALYAGPLEGADVDGAPLAVARLAPLAGCVDPALDPAAPPADPLEALRAAELEVKLAGAKASHRAGRYSQALAATLRISAEARLLGHRPLLADALLALGMTQLDAGNLTVAEVALLETIHVAAASERDRVVAEAWLTLLWVLDAQWRFDDAATLGPVAAAAVARAGAPGDMRSSLALLRGVLGFRRGDYAASRAAYEEAASLAIASWGPNSLQEANALHNLGKLARFEHRYDDALRLSERLVAMRQRVVGPTHPSNGVMLHELASIYSEQGRHEEALAVDERALAVYEGAFGPDHPEIADVLDGLGRSEARLGRRPAALARYDRAIAILEQSRGPDHIDVAGLLNNRGIVHKNEKQFAAARADHRRAAAIREKAGDPKLALSYLNLGELALAEGDFAAARAECERSLAVNDQSSIGPDDVRRAGALGCIGRAELGRDAPGAARAPLERAVALRERTPGDPADLAQVRFALARALWASPAERARARSLAGEARAAYAAAGAPRAAETAEIDAWLGVVRSP